MDLADKLVIAISSRVLFDLRDSHEIFEKQGVRAYSRYQIEHEDQVLAPGEAFPLVRKLLRINDQLPEGKGVEIVLLSRNSADTGLRIFNSIEHYGLRISRAVFCGGRSPYRYVGAFGCHLFLSTHGDDVRSALEHGFAAATLLPSTQAQTDTDEVRFAFDGDAVLFSDEAERVYQAQGLSAFQSHEADHATRPRVFSR